MKISRLSLLFAVATAVAALAVQSSVVAHAQADPKAPAAPITIDEVVISLAGKGDAPAKALVPGTLCGLRVKLKNNGHQKVSNFAFGVNVNGAVLDVYANQLYVQNLEPGGSGEIVLFNFYAPEAAAKASKVTVEVTLKSAHWISVKPEAGAPTSVSAGPVKELPISKTVTLPTASN